MGVVKGYDLSPVNYGSTGVIADFAAPFQSG